MSSNSNLNRPYQIFIQSPEFQIHNQTLTLTPSAATTHTVRHLKTFILARKQSLSSSCYFTLNGKRLDDSTLVLDSCIAPLSTLILRGLVLGGGGDGGATGAESRDCYLNMYAVKKPDKVDPNEQRLSKWLNCALSNEPLREPCVVDRLGSVFIKEALVEALLGKNLPREFGHIKGLKDVVSIKLMKIPGLDLDKGTQFRCRFQCPITGLEFNGKYKFFALKGCGHVLSAKALKEVKSSSCLVCHKEYDESDKIPINGSEEEVAVLRERMDEEKVKLREKKANKMKKANGDDGLGLDMSRLSGTKHGIDVKDVEKVSGKVEVKAMVENGGAVVSNGSVKRFKAVDIAPPNATKEVYASIFTSSRKSNLKETYSCRSLPLGRN